MKPNVWMADRISFRVQGKNVQRFLNTAVEQGIRLDHLRWETDGFTARGAGRDISKLEDLAQKGNWTFSVVRVVIQHFLKTIVVQFVFEVIG